MEEIFKKFLSVGSGDGYGYGDGSGSGDGDGYGYGSGYGSGSGYGYGYGCGSGEGYGDGDGYCYGDGEGEGPGSGSGDGYGYGDGEGVRVFNGYQVHQIDGVPTMIEHVKGNIAHGSILKDDFTTTDCWVAKVGNCFAHGESARKAIDDATAKYNRNKPIEERIAEFVKTFKAGQQYPALDFFRWHNILTGSCEMGRKNFCQQHGIDMDASYTPDFFIELTQEAYGGSVIKQLKEYYRDGIDR